MTTVTDNVLDVERSPGEDSLHREEARGALASLLDKFAVQLGSRVDLVVEEVQRERFGWPPVWRRVLSDVRYEVEYEERIEGGSKLLGVLNVIRDVGPQEELVPGFAEELVPEFLRRVGEQSRHERTFGSAQPDPQAIFALLETKAAVLEFTPTAAGT